LCLRVRSITYLFNSPNITSYDEALESLLLAKSKTVFVSGHFNVLHPGHLRLLRFAKDCGGRLIVGVESDRVAGQAAHVKEQLRLEGVRSISWVDEAILIDTSIMEVIERIRPNIVVKGKEHESSINQEEVLVSAYGGRLLFSSGDARLSSLDLIQREFQERSGSNITSPETYLDRHDIDKKTLIGMINKFKSLRVCVLGDLIVDEYITCQPLGMSREDPTLVVSPISSKFFLGGAGIVAAHASAMGASVTYLSISGEDQSRSYALDRLREERVNAQVLVDDSRPTTLKQRFRSQGKTLLRVNCLHQDAISVDLQQRIYLTLDNLLDEIDLIVFSDFNYGCLPQTLVEKIIAAASSRGVMMVADSQSSSQIGDIARFKHMTLITPTEHEARLSARNNDDGLVVLAEKVRRQAEAQNVFLKLGEEGLLIHAQGIESNDWVTDRLDALNSAPKDVAGAGDSMLIASALAMASGGDIWAAAYLGSLAAAIQVGRIGNIPINAEELIKELK
jgi:rfaE bifunctional protein kinase chain/domain